MIVRELHLDLILLALKAMGNDGWEPAPSWFLAALQPEERKIWEILNDIAKQQEHS